VTARVGIERLPPASAPGPLALLPPIPEDDAAWESAMDAARARGIRLPAAFVEALALRQRELGAGPSAEEAARRLGEDGALVVVAGQQPALLGGLLLAFHKAAGARHLARRLDARSATPVVPVFWLASEDHDLDEANRLLLLDREGEARRLRLDLEPDRRSLFDVPVDEVAAKALLAEAGALLPDTDRAREALSLAGGAPVGGDLATWCARSFAALLGDAGIVVLEPQLLLPYAGEVFADLSAEAAPITTALRQGGAALRAAGLAPPLDPPDDYVPLFLRREVGAPRERAPREPRLASRLRAEPALAGGDVVGRVFVQNRLLPVLAALGGPTELAYLVQVRAAHEAVGRPFPLAVPRPEATWVDAKTERTASAFGTTVAHLLAEGVPEARPASATELGDALEAWRRRLLEAPRALADAGGEVTAALARARGRLEDAWRKAARDLEAAAARDAGVGARRWARLRNVLRPRGRPQERALSAVSLVARLGPEALREGLDGLDPLEPGHHLLRVG